MREIKFRAWDTKERKWVEPTDCKYFFEADIQSQYFWLAPLPNTILMQYTGQKDKNGIEVYEGDIVREVDTIPGTRIVEWGKVVTWLGSTDVPEMVGWMQRRIDKRYDSSPLYIYDTTEVIGNICENPELLELE